MLRNPLPGLLAGLSLIIASGAIAQMRGGNDALFAEMEVAVYGKMKALFEPGDPVPGWDRVGIDLVADVDGRPGGAAANAVVGIDQDGERDVRLVRTAFDPNLVPRNWTLIRQSGTMDVPANQSILEFSHLDGPYFIVGQSRIERSGTALCATGLGSYKLYRAAGIAESSMPLEGVDVVLRVTERLLNGRRLCEVILRDANGLSATAVNGDGRSLPAWNALGDNRVTIVPRKSVADLLKG